MSGPKEYLNIKTFLQNVYAPNLSEEVFLIYEEEINPNDEAIIGTFY